MPDASQSDVIYDAGPQPGGREPAPGRLALVQAFANSFHDLEHDPGADLLGDPAGLGQWLGKRGLIDEDAPVSRQELKRALAVRSGLRALLLANNGEPLDADAVEQLEQAAGRASFGVSLTGGRAGFVPHSPGVDGALAVILSAVAESILDGTWSRFKACRQHDCHWAFYDHSRNGSGNWCSMQVCGARAKQRAYYHRARR